MSLAEPNVFTTISRQGQLPAKPTFLLPWPVLIYLAAVILPVGFHLGPLYLTATRLLLIAMIVPLGVNLIRGKYGRLLATDVFFLLHFCWIVVALAVNNPAQVVQNAGSTGVEFLGGYILGRAYIRDKVSFIALIQSLTAIVIICFPVAVVEAWTGKSVLLGLFDRLPGISTPVDLAIERRLGLERVQMSFEHPIHWGLLCSLATALCFVGLKDNYGLRPRIIITALICLSGLLALSSGAILAIALQLGLISWAALFRANSNRWLILLGLFAVSYGIVDLISNRAPLQVFMSYATFSAHSAYWRSTIFEWGMVNVWANPIFGLGLRDWVRPVWMHTPSVDNFWLLITMRYGIAGFAFLAAGYVLALWRIGRRSFDGDAGLWHLRRAWMFCFLGLTFTLTTVHIWGAVYALVFFFFGAGMWFVTVDADQEAEAQRAANPWECVKPRPLVFSRFSGDDPTVIIQGRQRSLQSRQHLKGDPKRHHPHS